MAKIINYRGEEALCEIGFQGDSLDKTEVETAVSPTITLKYLQSFNVAPNESVQSHKFINGGNGRNRTTIIKGNHLCPCNMSFWIPKDLDQSTPMEVWLLKMPVDGTDSKTEASPDVYVVPDATDEFGDDYLKVMTIEVGYNKAGSVTAHKLTGVVVDTATVHAEEGEGDDGNVLVTYDMKALFAEKITAFTVGSLTEATEAPFRWGDVDIQYGDAGGAAAFNGIEMFEFQIGPNVEKGLMDLTNSSGTPRRYPTAWLLTGMRTITGSFRLNLDTATDNGQDLWEDLYNDSTGTATPTEGVVLKDFKFRLNQDSSHYIRWTLHDVILGEIPEDIIGSGIAVLTIPFTATANVLDFTVLGTSTAPSGWAE